MRCGGTAGVASSLSKRTVRLVLLASLASMVLHFALPNYSLFFLANLLALQKCLQTGFVSRVAGNDWARLHCLAGGTQIGLKESNC